MGKQLGKYDNYKEESKKKWYKFIISLIEKDQRILFVRDVIDFLPFDKTKFYKLFPDGSEELETIHKLLDGNKVPQRLKLREMMIDMRSPQTVLAVYKTIATPEERRMLTSAQYEEKKESSESGCSVDIEGYTQHVKSMLQEANRYSPVLDLEIAAMASAWATLNAANKTIASLDSPFIEEVTTQGKKVVQHPAFALQQKALESMSRHSKLLGIDYDNAPTASVEGPLAELTKEMIDYTKAQSGHMSVDKEKKARKKKK